MARVLLDLNNPGFQKAWFQLERTEALAVLGTLRKFAQLDWDQLYRDPGLKWEAILSIMPSDGRRIYRLRISKRVRATASREGDYLRLISLHPDHDSDYG